MLLWAGLAGLLILSVPIVSDALLASLETDLPLVPLSGTSPTAIVILSADAFRNGDALDPGPPTLERIRAGVALQPADGPTNPGHRWHGGRGCGYPGGHHGTQPVRRFPGIRALDRASSPGHPGKRGARRRHAAC